MKSIMFPTSTKLLRDLSVCLGLKNATNLAQEIDEYAKKGSEDIPYYFDEYFLDKLFSLEYFTEEVRESLLAKFKFFIKDYHTSLQIELLLIPPEEFEYVFKERIYKSIFSTILKSNLSALFDINFLDYKTENFLGSCIYYVENEYIQYYDTSSSKYDESNHIRGMARKWKLGNIPPDITSLVKFSELCKDELCKEYKTLILTTLILARGIDELEKLVPKNRISKIDYKRSKVVAFQNLMKLDKKISIALSTKMTNPLEVMNFIKNMSDIFEKNSEFIYCKYLVHWHNAKYLLFIGEIENSINEYQQALTNCLKYNPALLEDLLLEALSVHSILEKPNKNKLRQIANIYIKYEFSKNRKVNPKYHKIPQRVSLDSIFDAYRLADFRTFFFAIFKRELFISNFEFLDKLGKPNFYMMDLDTYINIDLKNLNRKVNISTPAGDMKEHSQLIECLYRCDFENIFLLLEKGINVNALSSRNESALLVCIDALIKYSEINCQEKIQKHKQVLDIILSKKLDKGMLNAITSKKQKCILQRAIDYGNLDLVDKLLSLGCDVNIIFDSNNKFTPLYYAIIKHRYKDMKDIICTLLKNGADPNMEIQGIIPGYTPLMLALEGNYYELAKSMVEQYNGDLSKTYADYRNGIIISCLGIVESFDSKECKKLFQK